MLWSRNYRPQTARAAPVMLWSSRHWLTSALSPPRLAMRCASAQKDLRPRSWRATTRRSIDWVGSWGRRPTPPLHLPRRTDRHLLRAWPGGLTLQDGASPCGRRRLWLLRSVLSGCAGWLGMESELAYCRSRPPPVVLPTDQLPVMWRKLKLEMVGNEEGDEAVASQRGSGEEEIGRAHV